MYVMSLIPMLGFSKPSLKTTKRTVSEGVFAVASHIAHGTCALWHIIDNLFRRAQSLILPVEPEITNVP